MSSNLDFLALGIVLSAGMFLYFLTRLVVEILTVRVYARFLRELRRYEARQAELEEMRRFVPRSR